MKPLDLKARPKRKPGKHRLRFRSLIGEKPPVGYVHWDHAANLIGEKRFEKKWSTNRFVSFLPFRVAPVGGANHQELRELGLQLVPSDVKIVTNGFRGSLNPQDFKAAKSAQSMYDEITTELLSALSPGPVECMVLSPTGADKKASALPKHVWTAQRPQLAVAGQIRLGDGAAAALWRVLIEEKSIARFIGSDVPAGRSESPKRKASLPAKPTSDQSPQSADDAPRKIDPDGVYNTREAARLTGYKDRTLEAWRFQDGKGPEFKRIKGTRSIRYTGAALLAFISKGHAASE